jgi:hypothetical protein
VVEIRRFTREHLEEVLSLCAAEGWPSFPELKGGANATEGSVATW